MSWCSDGEPFDEYDPPYCETCRRTDVSYEVCKRCERIHNEEDEEDEEDGDEEMDKTMMLLPETVEEFMEQNKIVDTEQIYTNGTELVPIFRMKQWFISHPCEPPRWIPCSERLPEELEEVNVTWVNHKPEPYYDFLKDKPFTASAVYYKGDWYWYSSVCADLLAEYGKNEIDKIDGAIEITAWMPLPTPYKGGEEE